jgi:hypothetical protein
MGIYNPARHVIAFNLDGSDSAGTAKAGLADGGVSYLVNDLQVAASGGTGAVAVANTGTDGNAYFWSLASGAPSNVANWT